MGGIQISNNPSLISLAANVGAGTPATRTASAAQLAAAETASSSPSRDVSITDVNSIVTSSADTSEYSLQEGASSTVSATIPGGSSNDILAGTDLSVSSLAPASAAAITNVFEGLSFDAQEQLRHDRVVAINQMYQETLGRDADLQGLTEFVNGGLPLDQVQEAITNSPEAQARQVNVFEGLSFDAQEQLRHDRVVAINQMYQETLGRDADVQGLIEFVNGGLPLEQVQEAITNSPEAQARQVAAETAAHTSAQRAAAITDMFRQILAREPRQEGLEYWTNSNLSLEQVRDELQASTTTPQGRRDNITELYRQVLGREPSSARLEYFANGNLFLDQINSEIRTLLQVNGNNPYI